MTVPTLLSTKQAWQQQLANAISDPQELIDLLELDPHLFEHQIIQGKHFPLRVPRCFVDRMNKGDPHDPLLRQVLPLDQELIETQGYSQDPLKENNKNPLPGLLHKFHGRVLLLVTGACAIHCRYCFRQHFPYTANNPGKQGWQSVIDYIAEEKTISEVILSGGDPLVATDNLLANLIQSIEDIQHVRRLRIHSRLPIVLPHRITPQFINIIANTRLKTTLVIHCNHPQEIDGEVSQALRALRQAGVTLLNQAVLLKGVNDNIDSLTSLSENLFECGVLPYYLFTPDKVQGTAHFDIPLETAQKLHQEINERLPGYLVPRLAKEEPGHPAKLTL